MVGIRAFVLISSFGLALVSFTGCSTAVKQGYYSVMGAQGKFYEVEKVSSARLATYRAVRVEPFGNELGPRVPADVVVEVNRQTPRTVAKSDLFCPEGKTLRITGRIIHYTGRSGLEGSVMSVVGSSEDCVCRVQLLDDETGEQVGEAVCWGVVKSAIRRGSEELGIGVGKGVTKWISERLPQEEKERRREALGQKDRDAEQKYDEDEESYAEEDES